jgi:hypothetical protein
MPTDNDHLTKDEQYDARLTALRAAIDEGDDSGVATGDVFGTRPASAQSSLEAALARPFHPRVLE